jgi:hypothetical protein
MARRHTDDDDAVDENGILKDGRSVRVSLMDAMTVRDHQSRLLVSDAQGGTSGLHRPGYRIAPDITRDHSHYDNYDTEAEGAWKNDPPDGPIKDAAPTRESAYDLYDSEISLEWKGIGR